MIPILDSIIAEKDRALKLLELPLAWRKKESTQLVAFLERYSNAQSRRTCLCCECSADFQASSWMDHFKGSPFWGLQRHTCYECTEHICVDCDAAFCDECKKNFCSPIIHRHQPSTTPSNHHHHSTSIKPCTIYKPRDIITYRPY